MKECREAFTVLPVLQRLGTAYDLELFLATNVITKYSLYDNIYNHTPYSHCFIIDICWKTSWKVHQVLRVLCVL